MLSDMNSLDNAEFLADFRRNRLLAFDAEADSKFEFAVGGNKDRYCLSITLSFVK